MKINHQNKITPNNAITSNTIITIKQQFELLEINATNFFFVLDIFLSTLSICIKNNKKLFFLFYLHQYLFHQV